MPSKKRATPVSLQPLDALFGTNEESINGISEIAIGSLHPFPNHPFQVRDEPDSNCQCIEQTGCSFTNGIQAQSWNKDSG